MQTKFIFFTGGVTSSLGKGIASSSVAAMLTSSGYKIRSLKLDPYLNVDPGTMSPYEHGEVFVTDSGEETDLDLGHYERFGVSSEELGYITQGQIYSTLLKNERDGKYLGKTVQVIPHVTDIIKKFIVQNPNYADFILCEIGGTVGDIEAMPFLEAIRQLAYEVGRENIMYIHLTLIPYIEASKELKSKPTQHSVRELRAIGIQPDVLLCRADRDIGDSLRDKISLFCNLSSENVIPALDVASIYQVPIVYQQYGLDRQIFKHFKIEYIKPDLHIWENIVKKILHPKNKVTIAIVGKYHKLKDAYKSLIEALAHGGIANNAKVNLKWVNSRALTKDNIEEKLSDVDAILVPGGFGNDGTEGKILAIKFARENDVPFLGICLGMQLMMIEAARNLCEMTGANSTEFEHDTPYPIVARIEEWIDDSGQSIIADKVRMGGTMRLGAHQAVLDKDSLISKIYMATAIFERHRHRYEVNTRYIKKFVNVGLKVTGYSPDGKLPETVEYPKLRWFIGVQFHPEFKSKPLDPHPLFASFISAALDYAAEKIEEKE